METKDWKWFRLGDLFEKIYKATPHIKVDLDTFNYNSADTVPFVSRTETNNGCDVYVSKYSNVKIEVGNALVIGDTTASCFYQSNDFTTGDHMVVCRAEWINKYTGLFMKTIIDKDKYRFCYGRSFKMDIIKKHKIKLPSTKDGHPDWQYMEEYTKSVLIPKMPTRARKVWLGEYNSKPLSGKRLRLDDVEWGWFRLGELFDKIEPAKGTTTNDMCEGNDILYIAAKKDENGVNGTFSILGNESYISKGNCIVIIQLGAGSAGYAIYQPNDFIGMSGKICCAYSKFLNQYNALFIVNILDKERFRYCFGRSWTGERLLNTKIKLPITPSGSPDWQWIEDYIKGLPYSGGM